MSHSYKKEILQVLNLSDNTIHDLEGLPILVHLRELNLAGNPIRDLGLDLRHQIALTHLNLAATEVFSFKTLWQLSLMKRLMTLVMDDPVWGPAPVSELAQYRSHALFNLTSLRALDYRDVDQASLGLCRYLCLIQHCLSWQRIVLNSLPECKTSCNLWLFRLGPDVQLGTLNLKHGSVTGSNASIISNSSLFKTSAGHNLSSCVS